MSDVETIAAKLANRVRRLKLPNLTDDQLLWIESDDPDDMGADFRMDGDDGGPAGIGMIIEYRDSKSVVSNRRITVSGGKEREDGPPLVSAHCHERNARRTFRLDRIIAASDFSGEVFEPADVFRELFGVSPDKSNRFEPIDLAWKRYRSIVAPAAYLLAALARSDGSMDDSEVEIAAEFCASLVNELYNAEGVERVASYIRKLHPEEPHIVYYLDQFMNYAPDIHRKFLATTIQLARADGVVDEAELRLINELSIELVGLDVAGSRQSG